MCERQGVLDRVREREEGLEEREGEVYILYVVVGAGRSESRVGIFFFFFMVWWGGVW